MRTSPEGTNLLKTAHNVFVREILEGIPKEKKYSALMVAKAMAIAFRELEVGERDRKIELELFGKLYGEHSIQDAGQNLVSRLRTLHRRLVRDIREGHMDYSYGSALKECLFEQVRSKLRISNPKYLERASSKIR